MELNKKLVQHVNMTICEVTLDLYLSRNCTTHSIFCKLYGDKLLNGSLSNNDIWELKKILETIELIYGFSKAEAYFYVTEYFKEKAYLNVEKVVRLTKSVITQNSSL